jgi:uncharacterized MAPEG superfamily protein
MQREEEKTVIYRWESIIFLTFRVVYLLLYMFTFVADKRKFNTEWHEIQL